MCVGFPGRVIDVDEQAATVETDGRRRRASTLLFRDLAPGDWVLVAAGTVVDRLDPADAAGIRDTLDRAIASRDGSPSAAGGTP